MKKQILLLSAAFASVFLQAQQTPADTGLKELQQKEQEGAKVDTNLKINGYVDTYYQTNLGYNGGSVANNGLSPYSDSFELGNANLKLSQDFGKVGFVAQLAFGKRAELANFDSSPNSALVIQQAYLYYKPSDKITLTAGNFSTYVGYEVIDAPANFHYSVSNLFQNGPYYHQGIKADFNLGNGLGLLVGMFNQMDRKSNAQNGFSTYNYGSQLKYNKDNFNFYLNYLGGRDNSTTFIINQGQGAMRNQIDLVADYRMDKVYLAINPTYVTFNPVGEKSVAWYGGALYTQYAVSDKVSLGVRGEYIKNEDKIALGTGMADEEMWDITLSAPIKLAESLKIIPEFRYDETKNNVYTDGKGDPTNKQYTLGLSAMYSF